MAGEHVILLDEQDKPTGMLEKYAAHTLDTPLHLAFFPAGCSMSKASSRLRAVRLAKKARPGVWTQLCVRTSATGAKPSSRPSPGAAASNWASRSLILSPSTRPSATGRLPRMASSKNEVCPVYAACVVSELQPNDDEVMDYQWVELPEMLSALAATPWAFSPWMVLEAKNKKMRVRR